MPSRAHRQRTVSPGAGPQDVLDALPLSLIAVDSGGTIVGWNRTAEVIFGHRAEEMMGTHATKDVLGADPADALADTGHRGFTGRRWEAPRPDGSAVALSGGLCFLLDAGGRPAGAVAFAEDVSGRDPGETGLSEERFRTFMAHGPMVAFIKDGHGRHLYMNELMQQVDADQIKDGWYGRTDFDFWPEDVAAKICADDALVLAGDEPREFVETVPMSDGPHTWLTYKFPLPDAKAGRLLGIDRKTLYRTIQPNKSQGRERISPICEMGDRQGNHLERG